MKFDKFYASDSFPINICFRSYWKGEISPQSEGLKAQFSEYLIENIRVKRYIAKYIFLHGNT